MRFAIFVAVVAAHIVLLWLFPSLRRLVLLPAADEPAITPVFLPPLAELMVAPPLEPTEKTTWEAPLLYRSAPASANQAIRPEPPRQYAMRETERAKKGLLPAVEPKAMSEADATRGSKATSEVNETAGARETSKSEATFAPDSQLSSLLGPPSSAPDWRAQADVTAQANALHIVEAEDNSARQAAALDRKSVV